MERTRSAADSAAGTVVDRPMTVGHEELADILAMVATLEQLRRRGLTPDEMARHMDIEWVECPGGGAWTATAVTTILDVVDTFHLDPRPDPAVAVDSGGEGHWGRRRRSSRNGRI